MVGREVPEDDPDCCSLSTGPNLWPSSLPKDKFQDRAMAYQSWMLELVEKILDIFGLGLPKERGFFQLPGAHQSKILVLAQTQPRRCPWQVRQGTDSLGRFE